MTSQISSLWWGCIPSKHDVDDSGFYIKTQIRIMGALNILGNHFPSRQLTLNTELSAKDHCLFFHRFLNHLSSEKDEFVEYPDSFDELKSVMSKHAAKTLLGCDGWVDVVNLKWSNCPAGNNNRNLSKEGYLTLALEVIPGMIGTSLIFLWYSLVPVMTNTFPDWIKLWAK